jgi:Flp pilus assembly protein TadD
MNYSCTTAAFLAEALYEQNRFDEAEELTRTVQRESAEDDLTHQVLWRSVRGKVLARRGESDGAESLAREAVALVLDGDEPDAQANALMDLAEVLTLAGKTSEAEPVLADAVRRFEEKGNIVSAGRARDIIATLATGTATRL